ncbi:MAG: inositol monophosphatase, partial [Planctomycetaceae bacterium]|nr:inositol monophosphatase [Planctomycetaceae bacterium]
MSVSETDFLETAEEAARLGGRILDEWSSKFTVSEKGRSDYVTEADLASQEAIYNLI